MSRLPLLPALAATALVAGCENRQSALLTHGPEADQIAMLAWILFGMAGLILALVMAAVWLAMRGPDNARSWLARQSTVVGFGIILPVVTLSALLGYSSWLLGRERPADSDAERIEVVGEQWWWRLSYQPGTDSSFSHANEIRIPAGRTVDLILKSADVIHSFWVPSLAGKVDMIPGRITRLRLTAHAPGVFRGQCAEYCGGPHALMATEIVAMPAAEFAEWRERQAMPARQPETDTERNGLALFLSAGCGACHSIRGTPAAGTIGPDLTHVGSRRSVAANVLPMNADNLARFISDSQGVKPGSPMPPFRIFSDSELKSVTAYLMSLR